MLTHTSGLPCASYRYDGWADRSKRLEAFSNWRLTWEPGSRSEYQATCAHWVLVEIIGRRTGQKFRAFLRERPLAPLVSTSCSSDCRRSKTIVLPTYATSARSSSRRTGFGEVTPEAILRFNQPSIRRIGVPSAGGIASAVELAMLYQPLVNPGETFDGERVLKPETIEFATTVRTTERHRQLAFDVPVNRALSVVVAGVDGNAFVRGVGRTASARAFGHGGAGGQIGWGDPETGISVGHCTNGFVDWKTLGRRVTAISSLAASCAVEASVRA